MTDQPIMSPETDGRRPTRARRSSTIRKALLLLLLLLLLSAVVYSAVYYAKNRRLPIPQITQQGQAEEILPPVYVFSIAGPAGNNALTRPVGVAVSDADRVYATDTDAGVVRVYNLEGDYQFTVSDQLEAPVHLAIGPEGNLYASDRRIRAVQVFTPLGEFVRSIEIPDEEGVPWSPFGMAWDGDGNLYVTDVGITDKHRVIVFGPDGTELRRFGSTMRAAQMSDAPGQFYFPNGIVFAQDGRLYIGDSNNRRVQVFDENGEFDTFIRTSGIPRGMVIDDQDRMYVVDALAHTIDVYTLEGERLVSFGAAGAGPGQFRYPNAIDLDRDGRIYISDKESHQVQVWEWPDEPIIVPPVLPETTGQWAALCLSPLLLLPLLIWFRRKRFAVTEDFVDHMIELDKIDVMNRRRWKWVTPEGVWPVFEGRTVGNVDLGELIHAQEHSDSDARDLSDKMRIPYDDAVLLVIARRAKRLCTDDSRIAALARELDIEVFDVRTFLARFDRAGTGTAGDK
ncbi:MAG: NHL repeat-containing protein [Coriobacteriia bacterium]